MIQNFILARRHNSKQFELVSGPEVPYQDTQRDMREFIANSGQPNKDFAEVRLYSVEPERVAKFPSPKEFEAQEAQRAKDNAAHMAYMKSLAPKKDPEVKPAKGK